MKKLFILLLILAFLPMLCLTSCCKSSSAKTVTQEVVNHVITDKAELKKVLIEQRPVSSGSKEQVVVFSITLKNVTNEPLVYTATAIIDNNAAGTGTIPDDEAGLKKVMPGQELTDRVAVMYDKIPTNFVLYIDVEK